MKCAKALAAAMLLTSAQAAQAAEPPDIAWKAEMTATGGPQLGVSAPGPGVIEVYRCPESGACESQPLQRRETGFAARTVDVGSPAAGDAFEARYAEGGTVVATSRSPRWLGTPNAVAAPEVRGEPLVGATVTAIPARWSGGWGPPWSTDDSTELAVCRTSAGTDCVRIGLRWAKVLDTRFVGWYLFSTSSMWSVAPNSIGDSLDYEYPIAALPRSPRAAVSAPVGPIVDPIAAVPAPVPVVTPQPPTAAIRARALRRKGALSIGRVTCPVRCSVKLTVSSAGRKTLRRTLTVTGLKALTIPSRHGKLKVRVVVDGKLIVAGSSRAR